MFLADPARLQAGANADPEFRLAARYWNATLSLESPTLREYILPVLDEIRARE